MASEPKPLLSLRWACLEDRNALQHVDLPDTHGGDACCDGCSCMEQSSNQCHYSYFLASFKSQLKTFLFTKSFPLFYSVYRVLEALLLMPR